MPSVLFKQGFSKMDCLKIIDAVKEKNSIKVSSIKIPTLFIYGEKDSINKKSALKLSKDIKDSKLIGIKKSNHKINIEQPKKLADKMDIFWMYINGINMEQLKIKLFNIKIKYLMNNYTRKLFYEKIQFTKILIKNN